MRITRRRLLGLAGLAAVVTSTNRANAEILYATSTVFTTPYSSFLLTFNTASPGTLLTNVEFGGADIGTPAGGNPNGQQFIITGIDFRPTTSQLYGMGFRSGFEQRIYTINPTTGVGTALAGGPFVSASTASLNFDPVRNVIRLTSDQGPNNHINPATGATTADTSLAYAAGDPNAGQTPLVSNAAYSNHFATTASTTLYGIDARGTGTLVEIGVPGNGTSADGGQLHTVGPLNLSFSIPLQSEVGFFISPITGNAYAAIEPTAGATSRLYSINLGTGAATDLGQIGPNGTMPIWGLTVVPEPGSLALVGTAIVALSVTPGGGERHAKPYHQ